MEDHVDKDNTVDNNVMEGIVEDSFIEDRVKGHLKWKIDLCL